jgi:serine/threonine protein kinase
MAESGDLIEGRYQLRDRVGGGSMGVVWRAHDVLLDRDVAVKELLVHGGMTEKQAAEMKRRAMREARIAARLHHPHAISVFDVLEHAGRPCLIMEFVHARTLADLIAERQRIPVGDVGRIGVQLAGALSAAHAAGIVHRDVKPGNVLVTEDGTAKLTDFGISRAVGDSTITATGVLAGTPAYLAPEVAQGHETVQASDVFSLGATLFCAIEGEPPFGLDPNPIALLYRIANDPVPPPRTAGPLTGALTELLRADPVQRPTARQAERALAAVQPAPVAPAPSAPVPVPAHRGRRVGIAAAAILVVLAAVATTIALAANNSSNTARGPQTSSPAIPAATAPDRPTTVAPTTTTVVQPPPPTAGPASTASPDPTAADLSGQLIDAITGYYQLVPDNLSTAWGHMTSFYQQHHAGGRSGYEQFWQPVARVSVSDVVAAPPDTVTATVNYFYRSGNVVVERTRFGLVQQDGSWKIASSSVLSHTGTPQ